MLVDAGSNLGANHGVQGYLKMTETCVVAGLATLSDTKQPNLDPMP